LARLKGKVLTYLFSDLFHELFHVRRPLRPARYSGHPRQVTSQE